MVLHIPGNHDVNISEGKVDSSPFTERYSADRFVHTERGVRIVGVNSNLIKYNDPREDVQMEWMRVALTKETDDEVHVRVGAGEVWDDFVAYKIEDNIKISNKITNEKTNDLEIDRTTKIATKISVTPRSLETT